MAFVAAGLSEWLYARLNDFFGWLLSLGLSGKLNWIARDWLKFVLGIVIFGLAIDLVVYIVRYRPDKVWAGWIARLTSGGKAASSPREDRPRPEAPAEPRTVPKRVPHGDEPTRAMPTRAPADPAALPRPAMEAGGPTRSTGMRPAGTRRAPEPKEPPPERPRRLMPNSAERFQPAPPIETYDEEPSTLQGENARRST